MEIIYALQKVWTMDFARL